MKYLHLQFLRLRVWLRLRQMGMSDVADKTKTDIEILSPTAKTYWDEHRLMVDWFKLILTALAVLSTWLIFWLRDPEPIQIIVPMEKTPSSPRVDTNSQGSQHNSNPSYYVL